MEPDDAAYPAEAQRSANDLRVTASGTLVMLVWDVIGSSATRFLGIPVSLFYPGSMLIWSGVGFFVSREGGVRRAVVAGGALGVIDTTIGWSIASAIKGGGPTSMGHAFGTLVSMTLLAAGCALAGAGVARAMRR